MNSGGDGNKQWIKVSSHFPLKQWTVIEATLTKPHKLNVTAKSQCPQVRGAHYENSL